MSETQLSQWYQTALGREVAKAEAYQLSQILADLPGNHLLQLGSEQHDTDQTWLAASRVLYKWVTHTAKTEFTSAVVDMKALPFPNEQFEIVVLPHVLDEVENYPMVLREAVRVLKGDGYLLLLGFNLYSLQALTKAKPPVKQLPTMHKLRFWLRQSNCTIQQVKRFFFRPFTQKVGLLHKLQLMEQVGSVCWPIYGACYIVLARKQVIAMTPLNEKIENWWRGLASKPVIEPSTRNRNTYERCTQES